VLSFESAGELLVMLILGGVGRIYGAFVGPVVYLIAQDFLAKHFRSTGTSASDDARARGDVRPRWYPRHPRWGARETSEQAVSAAALETRGLCKSFGALTVADDINFRLETGARHALIGPNGAGKTTFVNMLSGALPPSSGRIVLGGEDITAMDRRSG